jgi:hypothetical protein
MKSTSPPSNTLLALAVLAALPGVGASAPRRPELEERPRAGVQKPVTRPSTGPRVVAEPQLPVEEETPGSDGRSSLHDLVGVKRSTQLYEAILVKPERPTPPEELAEIRAMGPILGAGDYPLVTLTNKYWRGGDPNELYYLPAGFRLAREADGTYGLGAVWTGDQQILLTLTLRADVDPAELDYARDLVRRREGRPSARLVPLPYSEASIVDLEGLEDWLVAEEIRVPSTGSLDGSLSLSITLSPESFASLKPLLETQGIGAGFELVSGEQRELLDIRISLREPSGHAYSPLRDVDFGYDPASSRLVIDGVRNNLEFPMTIDRLDIELGAPDWETSDSYAAVRVDPPVTLEPGATGQIVGDFEPSDLLRQRLHLAPGSPPRQSSGRQAGERILRGLLEELLEGSKVQLEPRETAESGEEEYVPGELQSLDAATLRYRLRFTPDFSCQVCFDRIWSRLEVVSYVERQRTLRVEVIASAFERDYQGRRLEALKLDLKSPHFSVDAGGPAGQHSVFLTADRGQDESLAIYLPRSGDGPLAVDYRVSAYFADGSSAVYDNRWLRLEDSLLLLLTGGDVAELLSSP